MSTTAPPAANPWDVDDVSAAALAILRLEPADEDAPEVATSAGVACELVDAELDMAAPFATVDDIPAHVHRAAVFLTVEMYRRKDAPFGVLNAWSVDDVMIRVGPDVMRSVRSILFPSKERFGVA